MSSARHRCEGDAAHTPSARLWLGNISNQATAASVRAAFESFGPVIDAAAFPARIGPLGYAIVVFERVRCCWMQVIAVQMLRATWHTEGSWTFGRDGLQVELMI